MNRPNQDQERVGRHKWVRRWTVRSVGAPTKGYTVALSAGGSYDCSCRNWKHPRGWPRVDCKHVDWVRSGLSPDWATRRTLPFTILELDLWTCEEVDL